MHIGAQQSQHVTWAEAAAISRLWTISVRVAFISDLTLLVTTCTSLTFSAIPSSQPSTTFMPWPSV